MAREREHDVDESREEAIRADERRRMREDEHDDERADVHEHPRRPAYVRGGVSFGSILTGMAVALGAFFLLTALVAGIALVVSQFLAYLWGGYTAGRMARGAGILNGLLVPIAALLLVALVAGIVAAFGAEARFAAPFTDVRAPVQEDLVFSYGIGFGIATLVAMFLGGILGGHMGARWHDKLEAVVGDRYDVPRAA